MYDHGFRLDDGFEPQEYMEPEVKHKGLLWVITRLAWPHCDSEDGAIMVCTRKWHSLEFTYMSYPGKEFFYIGVGGKEIYRKERDVQRDKGLPKDIFY